ncbi:MAG: hypothetical protein IJR99_12350 [Kiritimatiellae bacterium]|nr:hypothetical protein [Kiritimatiellia bacterium]
MKRFVPYALAMGLAFMAFADGREWQEYKEYPRNGRGWYEDPNAGFKEFSVIIDDGGNFVLPDGMSPGNAEMKTALEAMAKALQAEARLGILENNLKWEGETRSASDELLRGTIEEVGNSLTRHLNDCGQADQGTNFLAAIAWSGKYDDIVDYCELWLDDFSLNNLPSGVEESDFDETTQFINFRSARKVGVDEGTSEGGYVQWGCSIPYAPVAATGKYDDLKFDSNPLGSTYSIIRKDGDSYYETTVSYNSSTKKLVFGRSSPITLPGESCQCEGGGGTTVNCDCTIRGPEDVVQAECDPVFLVWRSGVFAPWKADIDTDIGKIKSRIGTIQLLLEMSFDPPLDPTMDPPTPPVAPPDLS